MKLERESRDYTASQYIPSMPFGEVHPDGFVNQDLENQTFADESFDLVITQDVFEHIFHPDRAIREIARTLRPGGAHIMTVPIVNKASPATRRASLVDGEVTHYAEPQYHGNPVGDGALVTVDWGYGHCRLSNFPFGTAHEPLHHRRPFGRKSARNISRSLSAVRIRCRSFYRGCRNILPERC